MVDLDVGDDRQAAAPSLRRMLVPLALAQFICSFAGAALLTGVLWRGLQFFSAMSSAAPSVLSVAARRLSDTTAVAAF